jgi:NTP pyrophosphatase (non-canonical NTP hydrolase)
MNEFIESFNILAEQVYENAKAHGFWDKERNDGEMHTLMHSELSESFEAIRHGNPPSDHIPEYLGTEEELADCIIRIMDISHARKWRVAEAVLAKMEFNKGRPYKHGKTC